MAQEEWSSDYDSTWEDDEASALGTSKKSGEQLKGSAAAKDTHNYRRGYPNSRKVSTTSSSNTDNTPNLSFYQNKTPYQPNGLNIDLLLDELEKSYGKLEIHYNCMQWLFPLQEKGMNSYVTLLTVQEIQMMTSDREVMRRFLRAYKLLLRYYGIKLENDQTGEVSRADNWQERFENLNSQSHNYLRISRILKCLGELNHKHFQAPLVRFFLEETLCHDKLPNIKRSALDYFMFTVKDKGERRKLVHFAWSHYRPQEKFTWGPVEKLRNFQEDGGAEGITTGMANVRCTNQEEDDMKEPGRDDSDDDMKEPGREDSDDDMKEPGREDSEEESDENSEEQNEPGGNNNEEQNEPGGGNEANTPGVKGGGDNEEHR